MDTGELERLRADLDALLPDTAYILSVTYSPDGYGGLSETWGTASTCLCRIDPLRGGEVLTGGAVQPWHGYQFTAPHGVTLTSENRVKIGAVTYSVKSVDAGKSWAGSTRVVLEVIE